MKKAVIFDMDGVLIDSELFYFNRRIKFLKSIDVVPDIDEFKEFIGLTDKGIWHKLIKDDEEKREQLRLEYRAYREKHKINYKKVLNPSVKELMDTLNKAGLKIGIASSSEKREILRMIKECALGKYIEFVISGDECKESKPSPEIYIKSIEAFNLHPKEAIAVEDSEFGITAAKLANIEVVALKQKDYSIDQSHADYIVKDLIEIKDVI